MTHYTEASIIDGIARRQNEVLEYVYNTYYPMVRHLVIYNNGTDEDATEVFQEAIIVVFEKIISNELDLNCSLKTFLYSISRNLWLQHLERINRQVSFEDIEKHLVLDESEMYDDFQYHRKKIYQKHFMALTEKCRRILELYFMNKSFDEIADVMGFSSRRYAIKRKYECAKSLFSRIYNDPEFRKIKP